MILVLKGVSLPVPEGGIVALLGGNGAGKTTTRVVRNLLTGERGEVTKGSIQLRASASTPYARRTRQARRGPGHGGRHCFGHLTIEENLRTGAYTRTEQGRGRSRPGKGLRVFPAPEHAGARPAAYTSVAAADVRHRPCAHGQPEHGVAR